MVNLIMFLGLLYLAGQIIGFISLGGSGIAATRLTQALTAESTTIPVRSTAGFLSGDYVIIDDELIAYSGRTETSFTGLTRGFQRTKPRSHKVNARVYNETSGMFNQMLGYNIIQTYQSGGFIFGIVNTVIQLPGMVTHALAKLIMFDYPFFDGAGVWLKYVLFATLGTGLAIAFIRLLVSRGG